MSDANLTSLVAAAAPLLLAVAALIRAYAASIESKVNTERLNSVEAKAADAHERVSLLETGNLIDAVSDTRLANTPPKNPTV